MRRRRSDGTLDRRALPGRPSEPAFEAAYRAALADEAMPAPRPQCGFFAKAIELTYGSSEFLALAPSTQRSYRRLIDRVGLRFGHMDPNRMEQKHVSALIAELAKTPAAQAHLLMRLRFVFAVTIKNGLMKTDPSKGLKKPQRRNVEGFATWSDVDIETYRQRWQLGTMQRLACDVMLETAVRRSDAVSLGAQHLINRDGVLWLSFTQKKTDDRVTMPVSEALEASLRAARRLHADPWLVTQYGVASSPRALGTE